MQKTQLDLLNESIIKKAKQREQNIAWMSKPENRERWNEYQNAYQKSRRQTDPAYRARLNAAQTRWEQKKALQTA